MRHCSRRGGWRDIRTTQCRTWPCRDHLRSVLKFKPLDSLPLKSCLDALRGPWTKQTSSDAVLQCPSNPCIGAQRAVKHTITRCGQVKYIRRIGKTRTNTYARSSSDICPNKQRKTMDGWMFLEALNAPLGTPAQTRLLQCFVYSDGTKAHQMTQFEFDSDGGLSAEELARSRWWPCLVVADPDGDDRWPFVCPALAWQHSRPWQVHPSRLRLARPFEGMGHRLSPTSSSASSDAAPRSEASSRPASSRPASSHSSIGIGSSPWQNVIPRSSTRSGSSWDLAD